MSWKDRELMVQNLGMSEEVAIKLDDLATETLDTGYSFGFNDVNILRSIIAAYQLGVETKNE